MRGKILYRRNALLRSAASLAVALLAMGCSDSAEQAPRAAAVTPPDLSRAGELRVSVAFKGTAPEAPEINMRSTPGCAAAHPNGVRDASLLVSDGHVANALVYIQSGLGDSRFPVPTDPVRIDQKGCLYEPRVAGAMVSQPVKFLNSDPEAHNVRGRPEVVKAWNFMIPRQKASRTVTFDKSEIGIRIGCDIHPWMVAYLSVFEHPYFAVTPPGGSVTLPQVPPGEYLIGVWHERLGQQEQTVQLEALGAANLEFVFGDSDLSD